LLAPSYSYRAYLADDVDVVAHGRDLALDDADLLEKTLQLVLHVLALLQRG
jgi:hypothetical protein